MHQVRKSFSILFPMPTLRTVHFMRLLKPSAAGLMGLIVCSISTTSNQGMCLNLSAVLQIQLKLHSNDFSLLYASSGLSLDPIAMVNTTTLREFWIKSTDAGIHIRPKDIKSRILSLLVKVNYPVDSKKRVWKGRLASMSSDDDDHADEDDKDYIVSHSVSYLLETGVY